MRIDFIVDQAKKAVSAVSPIDILQVPASASKEPELSGPVEEQCPVQEGAGEQAAEVVVSESSEPCSR